MEDVYSSSGYKDYLRKGLKNPRFGRGARTRLAEHMKVQNSHVTSVLNGSLEFTLEQGVAATQFFGLTEAERHYFMLLLQRDRSGTRDLRNYFQGLIDGILEKRNQIKNRTAAKSLDSTPLESLLQYYEYWHHSAIHMAIRSHPRSDAVALATGLKLDPNIVKASLELLRKLGFISLEKGAWIDLSPRIHMGDSPLAKRLHHWNWRQQALKAVENEQKENTHYSLVMSIDRDGYEKIRKTIMEVILENDRVLSKSGDEIVAGLNIDFFKVL